MNSYSITHANGSVDIVNGCKLEHIKETGQTVIYKTDTCLYEAVAVVPATSFVKVLEAPMSNQ